MRILIKNLFSLLVFILLFNSLKAQEILENGEDTLSYPTLPPTDIYLDGTANFEVPAPQVVQASDGTFKDCVRVIWQPSSEGILYKVFRSTQPDFQNAIPISNGWKKSNWIIDQNNVIPGKLYYYRVEAGRSSLEVSPPSKIDSGYARSSTLALPETKNTALSFIIEIKNFNREVFSQNDVITLPFYVRNSSKKAMDTQKLFFTLIPIKVDEIIAKYPEFESVIPTLKADSDFTSSIHIAIPSDLPVGVYRLSIQTAEQQENTLLDSRLITIKNK